MEEGYVLGLPGGADLPFYLGQIPATIGWIGEPPVGRGPSDQLGAEPLADVGITVFSAYPRFEALRCRACHLVEFTYDAPVYHAKAAKPSQAEPPLPSR